MSGHSKWSTIKRQKESTDQARGQVFTKLGNVITLAVREGGGITDPQSNFRLRLAIEKAKAANMPKENIARAIERATGKGEDGQELREILYEGFGQGGIAVLVEAVTDNPQRTGAAVKNVFHRHGGSLGGSGSTAYLFEKIGEIRVSHATNFEKLLELALVVDAMDVEDEGDVYIVYTMPQVLHQMKIFLEEKGIQVLGNELTYRPVVLTDLSDQTLVKPTLDLLSELEALDDVHKTHTNANFPKL